MKALRITTIFLQHQPPFVLTEVSTLPKTFMTAEELATVVDDTLNIGGNGRDISAPLNSSRAFGSKNPRPRKPAYRSTKQNVGTRLRRGKVLVVDDVADVTEMIALLLKHAGYDVSTAASANDALRLARKKRYDLIISDIGMPEMNGYELATALRELKEYGETPLIAVTGYSEYDDRGRAVRAGFNMHLTKPIEPTQLLDLVSELLA